jgi:hypothetical protein
VFLLVAFAAGAVLDVNAASLTYTNVTNVYLSSPLATFTINAGSVADALTVNATSVAVTLSSSTGGTFTLTSGSYDLTVASSSGGGTAPISCSSGVASVAISQSTGQTTYTIAPTASQCTSPSNGGGSGGSGGGGSVAVASQYGSPYIPGAGFITTLTASSSAMNAASSSVAASSSLFSKLDDLKAELASLLGQRTGLTTSAAVFIRNLSLRITGNDVKALQVFLIAQAKGPAATKLKAHGLTKNFGILTFNALREFQKSVGISPASGYFGPKTRAYVNAVDK